MKKCKRFSCLIAAVLLCLTLVCPVYAADSSAPVLTDEELYELEYERLLISGMDDEAALLSLDDTTTDRTVVISDPSKVHYGRAYSYVQSPSSPIGLTWEGSGAYNLASYDMGINSDRAYIRIDSPVYIDFSAPSYYKYVNNAVFTCEGIIQNYMYCNSVYSQGDHFPATSGIAVLYPVSMSLVINEDVVGTWNPVDEEGTFSIKCSLDMTESITSIAYRFNYSTGNKSVESNYSSRGLWFVINDNGFVTYTAPSAEEGLLIDIKDAVSNLPTNIYNFFFGDDGDDVAGGFKSEVDSAVSSVDQVQQDIVEGLDKPDPDTIVPDLEEVVPHEDYTVYTDIFAPVMQSSLFTSMMLVVVSMAFVSYVLFGKKG